MLNRDELLNLVDYDPLYGCLYWKNPIGRGTGKGDLVGTEATGGYRMCQINGVKYKIHRLIYLIETGRNPVGQIDHIDGIPYHNHFSNLREVSDRENKHNKALHRDGRLVGASPLKSGKYGAWIKIAGKSINLGSFLTELEAHQAYMAACNSLR